MENKPLTTPVLFLNFNRPDLSKQVFEMIRKVKPVKLFIAADGPRINVPEDNQKCKETREIISCVDWDCEIKTFFRDNNVGCKIAISSAINWFFSHVDTGIILEDDCLPSISFFYFCQELLEKYYDDNRIMQINGTNHLLNKKQFDNSYYYSRINGCWGWATWKRAWKFYDNELKNFNNFRNENRIYDYIDNKALCNWRMDYFERASKPGCNIWSANWAYAIMIQNGLMISPSKNLVQNVGFREDATNGLNSSFSLYSTIKNEELERIVSPLFVLPDKEADNIHFEIIKKTDPMFVYKYRRIFSRLIYKFTQYIPDGFRKKIKLLLKKLNSK